MRVALVLAGQPRFFERLYHYNQPALYKAEKWDIFLHAWFNQEQEGKLYSSSNPLLGGTVEKYTDEKLIDLFKPVRYSIQRQVDFDISGYDTTGENASADRMFANFSWPYAIGQAGNLLERYENAHNFRYDFVVVTRYDFAFHEPIPFNQLDKKTFYTLDTGPSFEHVLCDQLFIGSSKVIRDTAFKLYDIQLHYHEKVGRINSERNVKHWCEDNNIPYFRLPIHAGVQRGL